MANNHSRAWKLAHPERVRAHKRAFYLRHKDKILAQMKAKRDADIEHCRQRLRERYRVKKEAIQASARARYAADPEYAERRRADNRKYRERRVEEFRERDKHYQKVYRERHPEQFRQRGVRGLQKRRALKVSAFIEAIDSAVVFKRDRGVCGICHRKVDPKSRWHVDHIIPLSKGGVHSYVNVQLAHARCNWSKQDKVPKGQLGLFQRKAS